MASISPQVFAAMGDASRAQPTNPARLPNKAEAPTQSSVGEMRSRIRKHIHIYQRFLVESGPSAITGLGLTLSSAQVCHVLAPWCLGALRIRFVPSH